MEFFRDQLTMVSSFVVKKPALPSLDIDLRLHSQPKGDCLSNLKPTTLSSKSGTLVPLKGATFNRIDIADQEDGDKYGHLDQNKGPELQILFKDHGPGKKEQGFDVKQ